MIVIKAIRTQVLVNQFTLLALDTGQCDRNDQNDEKSWIHGHLILKITLRMGVYYIADAELLAQSPFIVLEQ